MEITIAPIWGRIRELYTMHIETIILYIICNTIRVDVIKFETILQADKKYRKLQYFFYFGKSNRQILWYLKYVIDEDWWSSITTNKFLFYSYPLFDVYSACPRFTFFCFFLLNWKKLDIRRRFIGYFTRTGKTLIIFVRVQIEIRKRARTHYN